MDFKTQNIQVRVVKDPTILVRVIEVIKRRRVNINKLVAEDTDCCNAEISINITASDEMTTMIYKQLDKLIDVQTVKLNQ